MRKFFISIQQSATMLKILSVIFLIQIEFSYAPSKDCGNDNEAIRINIKKSNTSRYLCPAVSKTDIQKLEELTSKYSAPLKYCLFETKFESYEDKICQSEPKPIFALHLSENNNQPVKCGFKKKHYLHYFGYFDCGGQDNLSRLRNIKSRKEMKAFLAESPGRAIKTYDVCFDISKHKTIYTRHRVSHLSFYQDRKFKDEPYCPDTISTDTFYMKTKDFLKVHQQYEKEKENPSNYNFRISPQAMVPPEHFAARAWKKTTNHYINRGALWNDLDVIRTSVNQGIKKAALQIFFEKEDPDSKEELLIYTKTITLKKPTIFKKFINWILKKHFGPSIWCIFIYNEVKQQGLMVYIHNYSSKKQPVEKKCVDDMIIRCDLRKWADTANDPTYHYPGDLQYAYCCKVTAEQAKQMFSEEFKLGDGLNIDDLVEKFNIQARKNNRLGDLFNFLK